MEEKIDVLLATYNGEKYLREQLDSILNQTYTNFNLIISDDCSTDSTRQILSEYKEKDKRISLYFHENNLGYIKNFEFLLTKVTNNYYMLSDQDDVWIDKKIEKSYETIKNEKSDLVFGDLEVVDTNLNTIYNSFTTYMKIDRKIRKYIGDYRLQYLYNCMTGCTIMSKKSFLKYILPLPTNSKYMVHDYWIGIMVAVHGKVSFMNEKYIKYRQHGNNQIGTGKESYKYTKLSQVRDLFINVKLGIFEAYVQNNDKFPTELQEFNIQCFDYYKMVKNKKHFNFKKWNIFHKLYKNETFMYYIENFIILNMPGVANILFKIRYYFLKLIGKR